MAEKLNASEVGPLPGAGRKAGPPRFAAEIQQGIEEAKVDAEHLLGIASTREDAPSIRNALYAAAKAAGVRVRTWALHDAKQPRQMVAYRVIPAPAEQPATTDSTSS